MKKDKKNAILPFSLPDWQTIPDYACGNNECVACASLSCNTWSSNSTTMCIPGITSENTPFATCSTDSDCTTNAKSLTGQDMYGRCICGYSDNGSQYCLSGR